jgi:hypothetical protein
MLYYHLHKTSKTSAKARVFDFLTPKATPAGPIPPTGRRAVGGLAGLAKMLRSLQGYHTYVTVKTAGK